MDRFGIEAFVDAFGLTETCAPILSPYGEIRPPARPGWSPRTGSRSGWSTLTPTGRCRPAEIGELVVRYKQPWTCSLGYYGMPEKTVEAWRNLWFHTGDALRRDEEGWYYFVDRYKDALRRRGENISSYEVEQALLGHPTVVECAVVGVPADVDAGEDEVLAVVVASGPVDAAELWEFCRGKIPAFAIPRFVRFVDALPKTPSEKIRKAVLRERGITADTHDRTAARITVRADRRRPEGSRRWCSSSGVRGQVHDGADDLVGRPPRRSAKASARRAKSSMSQDSLTSVRNVPAMTALTRTFGPYARANPVVRAFRPALAAAYGEDVGPRPDRGHAGDVDNRAGTRRCHARADHRGEPERSLQVDRQDLVEEILGELERRGVQR